MYIDVADIKELVEVCAGLVKEGVMFEASTSKLRVELTGGY